MDRDATPHTGRARLLRLHRPVARYFRTKRLRWFTSVFDVKSTTRVLDLGGLAYYWDFLDEPPAVTIINLEPPVEGSGSSRWVVADATRLPFRNEAFDVVFSNSLIEHIIGDSDRKAFADEVRRVGRRFCVQTPNRRFPIEPHLMTPLIHFLPRRLQKRLVRNFTLWGWIARPTSAEASGFLGLTKLIDRREFELLFPGATIIREKFLGLTKSFTAVGSADKAGMYPRQRQAPQAGTV